MWFSLLFWKKPHSFFIPSRNRSLFFLSLHWFRFNTQLFKCLFYFLKSHLYWNLPSGFKILFLTLYSNIRLLIADILLRLPVPAADRSASSDSFYLPVNQQFLSPRASFVGRIAWWSDTFALLITLFTAMPQLPIIYKRQ